ncbi:MAG: alpha/beta hydrolase-fold protein [Flavobacteriales bacterium]|nr:alpha/beta hydrolase-fold protein [Flavobacteriales bacterium]
MNKSIIAIGLLLVVSSCKKETFEVSPENVHIINSSFTKENYELKVILPEAYDVNKTYPVAYLLDGYYHFNDVANILKEHDSFQVILVGVFYEEYPFSLNNLAAIEELREIDLTYPIHSSSDGTEIGGGGLLFYDFLKEELIPLIEQNYSVDHNNRALMGHSLSAYFCLFQMFKFREDPLFSNVIALSPSLWWSNLEIIEMEQVADDANANLPFSLYLGIGEQEGVEANALLDELDERIINHNYSNLNYLKERYSGGHLHSAKSGFHSGLKFIFQ